MFEFDERGNVVSADPVISVALAELGATFQFNEHREALWLQLVEWLADIHPH